MKPQALARRDFFRAGKRWPGVCFLGRESGWAPIKASSGKRISGAPLKPRPSRLREGEGAEEELCLLRTRACEAQDLGLSTAQQASVRAPSGFRGYDGQQKVTRGSEMQARSS